MSAKSQAAARVPERRTPGQDRIFNVVVYGFVGLFSFLVFYSLYFVVIASFSDPNAVASGQVLLWPRGLNVDGYRYILRDARILIGYRNTILYTVFGTLLALVITIPAAYAVSRSDFFGRRFFMWFFIFTMYFSGGMVPRYLVVQSLGLVDSPLVMVILGSFSVFNLILCRTFFRSTIPVELQEAAEVDGCSTQRFFFAIVLPLSKSIIAIMVLYYAVARWNAFFDALIFLSRAQLYPLQLIMRDILIQGQTIQTDLTDPEMLLEMQRIARTIKYGVIIVSSLPVLVMYPFVQKYFVKGVMIGSVKG